MGYDWKDTLREKMSGYTEAGPEGLLQDIMNELDDRPVILKQDGRSNGTGKKLFIRAAGICSAAAASIAFLAILRTNGPTDSGSGTISVIQNSDREQIAEAIPEHTVCKEQIAETTQEYIVYKEPVRKSLIYQETIENAQNRETSEEISLASDIRNKDAVSRSNPDTDEKSARKNAGQILKEEWENDFPEDETVYKKKNKGFNTDIFYSGLTGSVTNAGGYSTMRQIGVSAFNGIPDRESVSATPGEGTMLLTSGEHSNTTVRHRHPVRIGASVRYNFTKCWGIETGLVYSFLSSRMETHESQYKSATEQKLHYIGIPIKINWSFLNREHFSLYLNAGGMLEKCIAGKALNDYILNGNIISSTKDNISIKPVQWSVNAAAGVQWNISSLIGIYAEPGISYHFDDGSPISTAYKERPFNFNLEIGLRFSFE